MIVSIETMVCLGLQVSSDHIGVLQGYTMYKVNNLINPPAFAGAVCEYTILIT